MHVGNADRGGAVACRVGQLDRRFEAGHQPLVGVGQRVGDGVQRTGVLDDAADVVQRKLGQAGIAVAGEEVLATLPDRLMHVHAGAVIADDGLGHEGRRFAVAVGNVMHDVLEDLGPVGALHQGAELGADFALAGGGDFVVMHFHRHAAGFQRNTHLGADVVQAVDRRYREVAALDGRAVAAVAGFELVGRGPGGFFGDDLAVGAGHVDFPLDGVENEELWFWTEVGGIADAGGLEIGLGAPGDRARVAVVALAVCRFNHVAGQYQRGFVHEGIDVGGVRVRHQLHVGGLNSLPAGYGRAVEGMAVFEFFHAESGDRHADVLLLAAGVGEAEVDETDFLFFDHLDNVLGGRHD